MWSESIDRCGVGVGVGVGGTGGEVGGAEVERVSLGWVALG
jgi:hypothetical protein